MNALGSPQLVLVSSATNPKWQTQIPQKAIEKQMRKLVNIMQFYYAI